MYTFSGSSRTPVGATTGYSTADPVTGSISLAADDTLLVALILYSGGADRTGGNPTFGGFSMIQADTARRGLSSPEVSTEMWYITASGINQPTVTGSEISVPNGGGVRTVIDLVSAHAGPGKTSMLQVSTGSANATTSTNPYCRITTTAGSTMIFESVANGANAWAPSARTGNFVSINENDIGNYGGGMMYAITNIVGVITGSWTFATAEDWGIVMAAFGERNALIYLQSPLHGMTSDEIVLTAYGPVENITVDNSNQAQITNGLLDLCQNCTLTTVYDAQQTQTANNVILTAYVPPVVLTVNEADQSQASDTVNLTQHQILGKNDSSHVQACDNVALTQHYVLSVYDSNHSQTADSVNLMQTWVIGTSDSRHFQTASSVDLIQGGAIGINDAAHLLSSGLLDLAQHYLLASNSVTQPQSTGNINLSQGGAIGVQSVIQAQSSDNTILTQHFVLVVLIATQLMTSNNVSLGTGGAIPVKMVHYMRLRSK